ncbi:hypothetical protein ACGFSD_24685 [Streptomyces caniferus]|uniref:hypothetical protein n=1 Tax=Streptomyces caniferus TaxID=285557 RepID=UPI0037212F04
MHIRHIPLYALGAGALAVSVLLFGDGEGADAATGALTRTVTEGATETGVAPDAVPGVVVQPDPVAPGAAFSVSDGGRCSGDTAEATFDDADLPAVQLSAQSGRLGGTATVPADTAPGSYRVTLTCGGASGARQSALDTGRADGDEEHGAADRRADGDGSGRGEEHGQESGDGRRTLTGTMIVSDGAGEVVPRGGADTGLGGAAGTGRAATTAGGALLLAAAGWGALARRRPRGYRS